MARSNLLITLERRYARLRGQYEVADQAVEPIYGLHAVMAKWDEIESTKELLRRQMDQIAGTIRQYDPTWVAERVKPIHPRKLTRAQGTISRYALAVLRTEGKPLSVRQIARAVAARLKLVNPTERDIVRVESAVIPALKTRLGKTVICEGEKPRLWRLVSRDRVAAQAASASSPAAANNPSDRARSVA